jgi:hypothetical protein
MLRGVQEIVWNGLWRKGTRERTAEFFRRYEELAPLVKRHLQCHSVFVAPFQADVRLRRRIEGALARYLRTLGEASSLLPADIRYVVRRDDECPIVVSIAADCAIEGLPSELMA